MNENSERFAYICPSVWRDLDVRTATSIMAAVQYKPPGERVYWEPLWNDALLARSRSLLATNFLTNPHLKNADVLVMIDSDVVFEPQDMWKIIEGARETRSVYGGMYVVRSMKSHLSSRTLPGTELLIEEGPVRRPIEIEYLATGFWAVHRDLLEAMVAPDAVFDSADGPQRIHWCDRGASKPFYNIFMPYVVKDPTDGKPHMLSEDWAFCDRARKLGFKVWADQSIYLAHMGWYPFTVADIDRPEVTTTPSQGGTDVVEYPAEPGHEDPLIATLVQDIADFMEDDPGDVRRMLPRSTMRLFDLWTEAGGAALEDDPAAVAAWYKREDVGTHYIGDLAAWAMRGGGAPAPVASSVTQGSCVLDFGAGIGTWALQAARAGAKVTAVEVNPIQREFIAWRANRHGLDVDVREDTLGLGMFDVVCCWHVFEHVANPERELARLMMKLKDGGLFISQHGFDDTTTPMHLPEPREGWEIILRRHGLHPAGPDRYILERGVAAK